ncbi:MAG TPA: sigma-70 family RNA polymerase sigma factor [Gemmataceae bacterium]|nr:sigma-70 family RNA polymerase sigma factor [Gemmataceae bacterium]
MSAEMEASRLTEKIERWIAEARGGSCPALDWLLEACSRYLLVVANRELCAALRSRLDPVDVVQDTLMKAWRHFSQFQGETEADWLAWLRQILRNNLANERRRHVRTAMRSTRREVPLAKATLTQLPDLAGCTAATSVRQAREQERNEALADAMQRLPAHYQQVLHLHTQEGWTFAQVGEPLHCSADAARKLWRRAADELVQLLGGAR